MWDAIREAVLYGSRCEAEGAGLLAQDSTTFSSLAYFAAAWWLFANRRRLEGVGLFSGTSLAAVMLAVGLGSVNLYGPQWLSDVWVHNAAVAALLLFVLMLAVARLGLLPTTAAGYAWLAGIGGAGLLLAVGRTAAALNITFLVAAAAIGLDIVAFLRIREPRPRNRYLLVGGALAVAVTVNGLGGLDGAWCRPDSLFQWHSIWHVLTAIAVATWAFIALAPASTRETSGV